MSMPPHPLDGCGCCVVVINVIILAYTGSVFHVGGDSRQFEVVIC